MCEPTASAAVENAAVPPEVSVALPICAPSLEKVTVPAGATPVTVAVNVTLVPTVTEVELLVRLVVVVAIAALIPTGNTFEVEGVLVASPLYVAVILCEPTASVVVEKVVLPDASVPLPICVPPSKNVTVPVGVELPLPVTVAVKVMFCPAVAEFGPVRLVVVVAIAALITTGNTFEVEVVLVASPL